MNHNMQNQSMCETRGVQDLPQGSRGAGQFLPVVRRSIKA
jgi:hypothetical protein